jgi:sugar/nucleoside kinase (ribokinase family)
VAEAGDGEAAYNPAARTKGVDVVGAGNAYCGGFLTGWVETGDIVEAGLRGAAAASLLLEEVGVPVVTEARRRMARERVEEIRGGVSRIKM